MGSSAQDLEQYLKEHHGFMRPINEVWNQTYGELEKPYPSIKLSDWPLFSEITGGIRMREFTILCGATGTGKTTLLSNISSRLLIQNIKHFVASVETGDTDFHKRVISTLMREDVNTGDPVSFDKIREIHKLYGHLFETNNLMLSKFDNRVDMDVLLSQLKYAHEVWGCKVAMLDNLNFFMEVTAAKDQLIAMDRAVHELVMFCKRTDMHVILVMHPRKTDGGRVESEFDIKGSSTAVQEASNVFLWNRPTDEDQATGYSKQNFRELKIAKLRRRGKFVGKRLLFRNLESCYEEEILL